MHSGHWRSGVSGFSVGFQTLGKHRGPGSYRAVVVEEGFWSAEVTSLNRDRFLDPDTLSGVQGDARPEKLALPISSTLNWLGKPF